MIINGEMIDYVDLVQAVTLNGSTVEAIPDPGNPVNGPFRSTFSVSQAIGQLQGIGSGEDPAVVYDPNESPVDTDEPDDGGSVDPFGPVDVYSVSENYQIFAYNRIGNIGVSGVTLSFTVDGGGGVITSTTVAMDPVSPPSVDQTEGFAYYIRVVGEPGSVVAGSIRIQDELRSFDGPLHWDGNELRTKDMLLFAPLTRPVGFEPTDQQTFGNVGRKPVFQYMASCGSIPILKAIVVGELLTSSSGVPVELAVQGNQVDLVGQAPQLRLLAKIGRLGGLTGSTSTIPITSVSFDGSATETDDVDSPPPSARNLTIYRQSDNPFSDDYNLYLTSPGGTDEIPVLPVNVGYPSGVDDTTYNQYEMYAPDGRLQLGTSSDKPPVLKSIKIFITLDDGPHDQPLVNNPAATDAQRNNKNRTERWLDFLLLKANNGEADKIIASFWVQTHATLTYSYDKKPDPDHPGQVIVRKVTHTLNNRGHSPIGLQMLQRQASDGHIIGIHTGSDEDHAKHWMRVNEPAYAPGGQNALESDLIRAVAYLVAKPISYQGIKYVRAPGFDLKHDGPQADPNLKIAVCATYGRIVPPLKHIGANIYVDTSWQDPQVPIGTDAGSVIDVIDSDPAEKIYKTADDFIAFLFHDPTKPFHTLAAAKSYLEEIRTELKAVNKVPQYVNRASMEKVFDNNFVGVHC